MALKVRAPAARLSVSEVPSRQWISTLWVSAPGSENVPLRVTSPCSSIVEADNPSDSICGATLALARVGILDKVRHTSNALPLLQALVPTYGGEELYRFALAVSDDGVITASGIGAMEFAHEILKTLGVYDAQKSQEWLDFFRNGVFPAWMAP